MDNKMLRSIVRLDNKVEYFDSLISCSENGMSISSASNRGFSPSIQLYLITDDTLISAVQNVRKSVVKLSSDGNYLGAIRDLSGYAACDTGVCERAICTLRFELELMTDGLQLQISGTTTDYFPETCGSRFNTVDTATNFEVELLIPDESFESLFIGKLSAQRAKRLREARDCSITGNDKVISIAKRRILKVKQRSLKRQTYPY